MCQCSCEIERERETFVSQFAAQIVLPFSQFALQHDKPICSSTFALSNTYFPSFDAYTAITTIKSVRFCSDVEAFEGVRLRQEAEDEDEGYAKRF